jgi:hypothetical protein
MLNVGRWRSGASSRGRNDTPLYTHPDERVAALEAEIAKIKTENAQLKQMLFRAYDYVGVPDDKHAIWGPIRAVLIARTSK